jgi:hypothetical protein
MLAIAESGWPTARPTVTPPEAVTVARFLIGEMLRLGCRFDLRLFVNKALPDFQQVKDGEAESDWRDLVTAAIEEQLIEAPHSREKPPSREERLDEEHAIVREILQEHGTRQGQVDAWIERTGKSERAFYRRRAEIDNR